MAYGYIPSPFGGKPSSLDIAKAEKRDRVKDAYVRGARKTPMSRAELERTDKPTGLDYLELTDSTELANDRLYRDENFLSEVNLASNTPYYRELKQDRANPNVQTIEDSRHADFDQYEYLDKSKDESINKIDRNHNSKGYDIRYLNADKEDDISSARRTPMSRAYNQKGGTRFPFNDVDDNNYYRKVEYHVGPKSEGITPDMRAKHQGETASAEMDRRPDSKLFMEESLDKSKDKPWEEREAMRTPHGRARAVSVGGKKGEEPYYSKNNRSFTQDDVAREEDAIENTGESMEISHKRGEGDNPVHAERTPQGRAWAQHGDSNRGSMFERDERGQLKDVVGNEHIHKSEDESISKDVERDVDMDYAVQGARKTPMSRANAVDNINLKNYVNETGREEPYSSYEEELQNRRTVSPKGESIDKSENEDGDNEDYEFGQDKGTDEEQMMHTRHTPSSRAFQQGGERMESPQTVSDKQRTNKEGRAPSTKYSGEETVKKSEDESIGKVEGWVEPDEYKALRTPVGRDMAIARAKYPEADGSVYAVLGGDELRTRSLNDELDENQDLAPPSPEEYEYAGVEHAYKSASAPIHKSEDESISKDRDYLGGLNDYTPDDYDFDDEGDPREWKRPPRGSLTREPNDPRDLGMGDIPYRQRTRNARKTPYSRAFNQAEDKYDNRMYDHKERTGKMMDKLQAEMDKYVNHIGPSEGHQDPGDSIPKTPAGRAAQTGRSGDEQNYVGNESYDKSASAPIHKSIQTPIRDLIKERRYWK